MHLPLGPQQPAFWQMLQIIANPTGFLGTCADRYGDTFTLRILGRDSPPVIFLSQPETIQAVFTGLADRFEYGKVTQVFAPLVGQESLIMQQGKRHQHQRQMIMPAFAREKLQVQAELIRACTIAHVQTWQVGDRLSMRAQMSDLSLRVILAVVFGMTAGDRFEQLRRRLTELLERITGTLYSVQFFLPPLQRDWGRWSPWGGFLAQMAAIDTLILAEITDRRSQGLDDRADLLSSWMQSVDLAGAPLGDQELRDQLVTLLLLGHETTASALAWAFYWLHRQPELLGPLRAEVQAHTGSAFDLAEQPQLSAVCKEALRVYPIALISQPRRVRQAVTLEGYDLSPGTVVIPCIYTAHRRSATYGDATVFRPDRFIERKFSASEYFPFGGGSRNCIGMALSLMEMKLILGTIIQQFTFTAVGESRLYPVRRGITFVPPEQAQLQVSSLLR
jgi:cytochrome P450 family 110